MDTLDYLKLVYSSFIGDAPANIDYQHLKNKFLDLMVLKTREMNSADVAVELQNLISEIEKDIDEYFPVKNIN